MLSLCLFYAILFLFPFLAFSVSYPPSPYSSGDGFSPPPPPPPLASSRQGFSSPPPPPPFASRRQGFSSPPPPPPYSSSGEGFSSPPPPHASVRVFRSPPPPPPHPSGEGFRPPPPPPPYPSDQDNCQPYGSLFCGGQYVPTYICSPKITSSTPAILVTSDFSGAGGGGGPSECDGKYHNNSEIIVGLSTGWYNGGLLCGKMIKIMALNNGKSVVAKVVDECDSMRGCDEEHSGQPPCGNNIINGSDAVWAALGLDKSFVEVNVSWSRVMDVGCDSNINYIVHIM